MPLVLECKRPFSYPAQVFWTLMVKNNVLKQELNFRLVELNERVTTDNNGIQLFSFGFVWLYNDNNCMIEHWTNYTLGNLRNCIALI